MTKGQKNQNDSSKSSEPGSDIDQDYFTIRISKSAINGTLCALIGALAVIIAQKLTADPKGVEMKFHHGSRRGSSQPAPGPTQPPHQSHDDHGVHRVDHQMPGEGQEEISRALEMQRTGNYIHMPNYEDEEHPNPNIRGLPRDLTNWPYGALGLGVELDHRKLSSAELAMQEEMYKNHAFQEYVSELIPLNRTLPDFRGDWCKAQYDGQPDLKPVSIIICFHNEAWSTLLRSVHSVVNRTPKNLISEILLVDDKSTMPHLGRKLDDYIRKEFSDAPVKVIRQKQRQGLMRSRMAGIEAARKDTVLLFLDSHIEVTVGWLEPLLTRIKEDPKLIISPQIDHISDESFYYKFVVKDLFGLTNWNLGFEWHELSRVDINRKPNTWAPHASPVMAGGLFAIDRAFFEELGYYDTGMEIWGAENLELSFKTWMCGGRIEISPCSRVGHVFRSWSPYAIGPKEINKNKIRTAEVWMDEFKHLFYHRLGNIRDPLKTRLGDFGDVSERVKLRKRLGCRSFKWYMDHVATALPYHQLAGAGEVKNVAHNLCIDQDDKIAFMDNPVGIAPCHGDNEFQYWWFKDNNFWLRDYMCVGVTTGDGETVTVTDCARSGLWAYDVGRKQLRHSLTGKCLTVSMENRVLVAAVKKCATKRDENQEWEIQKYDRKGLKFDQLN